MSDDVRLGLVIGGVIVIVAAVVWRHAVLHGRRTRAVRGLDATDPQDRARAAIELVDQGLQRCARPILARVATEQDDRVRLAIALAVARRQWEPVDTTQVVQLREWASLELERQGRPVHSFGPALTRLSDMGGPRAPEPEPDQATTPPAAPAASEPESEPDRGPEAEPSPAPDPKADGLDWHASNGQAT